LRIEGVGAFLDRELRSAVAAATDARFLALIAAGATSFPSSGSTASGALLDLRALLQSVSTGVGSQLFLIVPPTIAKAWATIGDTAGGKLFPDAVWNGGTIGGVPVIPSDGASSQTIILADATGIAAAQEGARFDTSSQGSIQLDSAPDSPPTASTNMISLWQNDLRAIKVERFFAAKPVRPNAVAVVTGANYTGSSP
jgi:hypothetical protein